jgi:putative endonuclease
MAMTMAYTYIVKCADSTYYTGWTTDITARVAAHNAKIGARYTRSRVPVQLVYWEEYGDKQSAQRREAAIKKMTRAQKVQLIRGFDMEKRLTKVREG